MPLNLTSMNAAIVCDDEELETYDVKHESTSSLTAFIASEAGKQFEITFSNNTNFEFAVILYIDGQLVQDMHLPAEGSGRFLGPYKSECSILPFKFQELELVDPDLEDAPVAPEIGTIELKAYRCQTRCTRPPSWRPREDLRRGRVSELSKKAGWHHVATGDEIPVRKASNHVSVDYLDSRQGPPYASIKVLYRPRELLRAQGIILGNDVGRQGSPVNKKRARKDVSPGPSRSRPTARMKREELSGDARAQRMQALQAELDTLKAAEQPGTSVKCELRSPSPIVVRHSGEIVDLTLDD